MVALRPLLVRDGAVLVRAAANVLRSAGPEDGGGEGGEGGGSGGGAGGGGGGSSGGAGGAAGTAIVTLATPHGGSQHQQQQVWFGLWLWLRL